MSDLFYTFDLNKISENLNFRIYKKTNDGCYINLTSRKIIEKVDLPQLLKPIKITEDCYACKVINEYIFFYVNNQNELHCEHGPAISRFRNRRYNVNFGYFGSHFINGVCLKYIDEEALNENIPEEFSKKILFNLDKIK